MVPFLFCRVFLEMALSEEGEKKKREIGARCQKTPSFILSISNIIRNRVFDLGLESGPSSSFLFFDEKLRLLLLFSIMISTSQGKKNSKR